MRTFFGLLYFSQKLLLPLQVLARFSLKVSKPAMSVMVDQELFTVIPILTRLKLTLLALFTCPSLGRVSGIWRRLTSVSR